MSKFLEEYIPEEFNILDERAMVLSVQDHDIQDVSPLNTVQGATSLEFLSLGYNDKFKDLSHVFLNLKLQVVKENGDGYKATDSADKQPSLVCNALHSIFKSAFVSLNGNNLRNVEQNYHYKEYIETTLNFSPETAKARLSSQMYFADSDKTALQAKSKDNVIFDVHGRVNLLNISKLLLPGVSVKIRFNMEAPDFFIMENTAEVTGTGNKSQLKILEAKLFIRHVSPKANLLLSMERALASGKNAVYEYKRGEVITQTISANISSLNIPNFYNGPKPCLIALGFVENSAYTGDRMKNPFEFKPFGLSSFNFIINGVSRPSNPYKISTSADVKTYNHLFSKLYEAMSYHNSDKATLVNSTNFMTSHFLILEDLAFIPLSDLNETLEECTIGVNGTFSSPLTAPVTCIMYMLLPSRFEISANRSVSLVY